MAQELGVEKSHENGRCARAPQPCGADLHRGREALGIADPRCLRQAPPLLRGHLSGRKTHVETHYRSRGVRVGASLVAGANGQTLALPENLTGFSTRDGESYFAESDAREAYFPLASNFLTQRTQAYCGVASIVMVLNALGVPQQAVPEYTPYRTFTQDNVLSEADRRRSPARRPGPAGHDARSDRGHPRHSAGQGGCAPRLGELGRRVPQGSQLVSRRARPFRDRKLPAQGARARSQQP